MKNISLNRLVLVLSILIFVSCAFFRSGQKKELTLKKEITKGVTTEANVMNLLGMPTSVTPNSIGDEVWFYKNLTYSFQQSNNGKSLILWEVANADSSNPVRSYNLLITIDQNDIVKDFKLDWLDLDNF